VKVPDKLPPQPVGSLDIIRGAFLRAINGYRETGEAGVGVEAGPMEFYAPGGFIETQVSVIIIDGVITYHPGRTLSARVAQLGGQSSGKVLSRDENFQGK